MNEFRLDTTEALQLEFWQLENEANVRKEAQDKARLEQERMLKGGMMGESASAGSVISGAIGDVVWGLKNYIEETLEVPKKGRATLSVPACNILNNFNDADLNNIAADSIAICLNGVGVTPENALIHALGEHVEHEFMLRTFRAQDKKAAKYLGESIKAQGGTVKQRYRSVEYSLSANRLQWSPWDSRHVILIGQIVFTQVLKHSGIFDMQTVVEVC